MSCSMLPFLTPRSAFTVRRRVSARTHVCLIRAHDAEFMDTFIFVLRKSSRQVTFLHVYHHSSITFVTMLAAQFDTSGDTYLPALLNSWIHVLMYGHYFLTSIGVKNAPW